MLVGWFDVGTDEHEFFDGAVGECLADCLRRRDGRATAGALNGFNHSGLAGEAVFHRVGRAMKNNYTGLGIRDRSGGFGQWTLKFTKRLAPLTRHAQPGDVNTHARRRVSMKLRFRQAVARRNDEADARFSIHRPGAPRL